MSRLLPGDRVGLESGLRRDGEVLPAGTMGTVVSVDMTSGRAEVDWDVAATVVLHLETDPFWIQLCSGYGPPPEAEELGEQSSGTEDHGLI